MNLRVILICVFALVLFGSSNPDPYPNDYFRSPLGIPLFLSGGFAEMRSNHFHGGLDIKTQGQTGYKVYAAADGWISRIVISPSGYGNALYISHPNGYMTVYGHLDRFRDDVQAFMKKLQYQKKSFSSEYFPSRDEFPVLKGEEVALSGNTGGSAGPHLHFEIRDERTGFPVNPMLWGFDIKDDTPPRIFRVKAYAISDNAKIRMRDSKTGGWVTVGPGESGLLEVSVVNGKHVLSRVNRIEASGQIGFSIQAHDYHNGSTNRLGLYTIELQDRGSRIFKSSMDRFSFDQTRYINAHADYAEYRKSGRWFQRSFVLPGNNIPLYDSVQRGIISMRSGSTHEMKYEVTDAYNNRTELNFSVFGIEPENLIQTTSGSGKIPFDLPYDQSFSFRADGFALNIPSGALYESDQFKYSAVESTAANIYSDVHRVHKAEVPLHAWATLEIVPTKLPADKFDKAGIVRVRSNGSLAWAGGSYYNGVVKTQIRDFDSYAIGIDDKNPTIRLLNISSGKNMSQIPEIRASIADGLSGIQSFEGKIDGEWVLFEYDAKNASIKHRFESSLPRGSHVLEITVVDGKNNSATVSIPFVR